MVDEYNDEMQNDWLNKWISGWVDYCKVICSTLLYVWSVIKWIHEFLLNKLMNESID